MREKELFSQTMIEFFAPIENQRYILESTGKGVRSDRIFPLYQASLTNEKRTPKPL